jgi:hypothetical protein
MWGWGVSDENKTKDRGEFHIRKEMSETWKFEVKRKQLPSIQIFMLCAIIVKQ